MGIVPCGMTYSQRLRSVSVDSAWMPAKNATGANYQRENYYDADALEDMLIPRDAEERMMDETAGAGWASEEEIRQAEKDGLGDLVAYHYGMDDSPVISGG